MKNYLRNRLTIGAFVVILVIVTAVIWRVRQADDSLSVVYLATGEVYIGTLSTFPRLTLAADDYQFQTVPGQGGTAPTTQLVTISEAQWAPKKLYLNRDQVVLYGPLSEESAISATLRQDRKSTRLNSSHSSIS